MKKRILAVILFVMMMLSASVNMLGVTASAASNEVYVSASGNDEGDGTKEEPYGTFNKAIAEVANNGIIHVVKTVSVTSWGSGVSAGKTVTVTGGTLNFTGTSELHLKGHVTFDNVTLTFTENDTLYANGHKLVIKENVTLTNPITVYGGKKGGTIGSTDIEILAGTYNDIYGGSNGGTVTGDTNVHVGGNVNSSITVSDAHEDGNNNFYGGGTNDIIDGGTYITVDGNAKAHYVYGGSHTGSEENYIAEGAHLYFYSGTAMSLYGGGSSVNTGGGATLVMTGGNVEQIFGGCSGASMIGDITVQLLGGTITGCVYGGCYNEWKNFWKDHYYVEGDITLVISNSVNIDFTYDDMDRAIYARSRHNPDQDVGDTNIIFLGEAARSKYEGKLGSQESVADGMMLGVTASDHTCTMSYSASGNVITETAGNHTATATLKVPAGAKYNGSAIEGATVTYGDGWLSDPVSVSYTNNVNVGTATVTCSINGATVTDEFTISKGDKSAPDVSAANETLYGKNDGKISGLTVEMEYSTDNVSYTKVIDVNMPFAVGTYYVRYAENDSYTPSEPAKVTVGYGPKLTVIFKAEGSQDIVKEVAWKGTLTDIPAVPGREGYTYTAPYWNRTTFANITENIEVWAIYTPDPPSVSAKNETIFGKADGGINGLTVDMEYGTDRVNYTRVEEPDMELAPGKYYVRYAKNDAYPESKPTEVNISAGRMLKVTFIVDRVVFDEREVAWGGSITEVPDIPAKAGNKYSYWDTTLENIKNDLEVTAKYTNKDLQMAPAINVTDESIAGKNDGKLSNLTADMEYRAEGVVKYTPITSDSLRLAPGTYYVRYTETDKKEVSPDTVVTIGEGRKLKVTFMADGKVVLVKELRYNESITELPDIPEKDGYTHPVWEITSIVNVTEDITVNAKYTKVSGDETVEPPVEDKSAFTPPVENEPEETPPVENVLQTTPPVEEEPEVTPSAQDENTDTEPAVTGTEKPTDKPTEKPTESSKATEAPQNWGCGAGIYGVSALAVAAIAAVALLKKKED